MNDKQYGIFDQIHFPNLTIPGIMMGSGNVGMAATDVNEDGYSGVFFFDAPYNTEVGAVVNEEYFGMPVDHTPAEYCMLFDNPKSIDVLIGFLEEAKEHLLK